MFAPDLILCVPGDGFQGNAICVFDLADLGSLRYWSNSVLFPVGLVVGLWDWWADVVDFLAGILELVCKVHDLVRHDGEQLENIIRVRRVVSPVTEMNVPRISHDLFSDFLKRFLKCVLLLT